MPLIVKRDEVLSLYEDAARRRWVIPAFGVENLTTVEAVLAGAKDYGDRIGCAELPITLAITNLYAHRRQSGNYTHTKRWDLGMKLFMADAGVLTAQDSPFGRLNVMIHPDHIQHDVDADLLAWDMGQFSSIMYDASNLPFEDNMEATRRFVEAHREEVLIEGACDEIVNAAGAERCELTTPERAETYAMQTGVDFVVANLGTEHRASAADLTYHGDLARQVKERLGTRLVLHGCSSVPAEQVGSLFADGICKVNLWTALERDSSPALLAEMVTHAAKIAGRGTASQLGAAGLLGPRADLTGNAHLDYFTTVYRQGIIFQEMKRIVVDYLSLWYV